MKLTLTFIWLVVATGVAQAASPHSGRDLTNAHARHARREIDSNFSHPAAPKQKRCKPRPTVSCSTFLRASSEAFSNNNGFM